MRCFTCPPDHHVIQFDQRAVEPHTLAHFSQDPALLSIYGPNAFPHGDIYLLAGQRVPVLGPQIQALYDPKNPTKEGVAEAKKRFAEQRKSLLKPSFLGWIYGIGADTLSTNLEIPLYQARQILQGLDKQFPGKAALQKRLEQEWAIRGGYIVNGRGRPLPVDFGKKKDLVNRLVQSSAHDSLVRILWHLNCYRKEHKIEMRPAVSDFHDESLWYVRPHDVERARECIEYAFDRVNDELGWTVQIRHGGINVGQDFSVRCDE